MVSYVYDSCGKLISIDGSLKDSVEVKNPYRYRGYRYDAETELYYLNSRYYNPEFGRFINADGIIGKTGELLGHNLFIYSKNNPVNMSDSDGFRPEFSGTGHDTGDSSADSFAIMNKRYDYNTGKIMPISNGFNFSISTLKSSKSAVIDSKGEQAAEDVIRGRKVYKDLGMGIGKYEKTFTIGKFVGRNALKYAGTIIFTTWDVGKDIYNGEYYGALVDATTATIGIGIGIELAALGAPAVAVAISGVGVGVGLDWAASQIKYKYYRRQ